MLQKLLLLFTLVCAEPIIKIKQGEIKGIVDVDWKGREFYSFLSIPYAKPPVEALRFKEPQIAYKWDGVLDCTKEAPICFQRDFFDIVGQEDCLYLNVHTPQISYTAALPVMVFIHGGGYMLGSGSHLTYGANYLMNNNIVLVTLNYRLGILGFLDSNDENINLPPNNGMRDQVFALKWVQENIQNFGGNPNLVTIFGESAGGASVHLHVLSPLSKGLFHRAILQSGCALNPWAYKTKGNIRYIGEALNIEFKNDEELLERLQKVPREKLLEVQEHISKIVADINTNEMVTSPKVEDKTHFENFLEDQPINIIKNGDYNDVPLMFGYNDKEGIFVGFVHNMAGKNFTIIETSKLIPHSFNVCKKSDVEEVIKKVNDFYYKQDQPAPDDEIFLPDFTDVVTDTFFTHGIQKSVKLHSEQSKNSIYFYRFSMDTKYNMIKYIFPSLGKYSGAAHLDELTYLFKPHDVPVPEENSVVYKNVEEMTQLWTNFAKYGNPTPNKNSSFQHIWKPVTPTEMNYYEIGNEISVGVNPDAERYQFWENIYQTYSCSIVK